MNSPENVYSRELRIRMICITVGVLMGILPLLDIKYLLILFIGILFILCIILLRIRYESIVFLNIVLLSMVIFEPAPADILFPLIFFFGLITEKLNFEKIRKKLFFFILLSGYIIINLLGLTNMLDPYSGMRYFMITFYLFWFTIFSFLYVREERFDSILKIYVISTIFAAVLGFIGYMGHFSNMLMYDEYRVKALFKDPNVFGPFLVPGVVILIDDLRSRKIFRNHLVLYILSIALLVWGVVFSFSRAAWINLTVCISIYFLLNIRKYSMKEIIIIVCIICLCATFLWLYVFDDNLKNFFISRSSLQSYDEGRFTSQKTGLSMALDKIFGYGPGQYEQAVLKTMNVGFSAHNLYIRLLLENGVIGFLLFMMAILYILLKLLGCHINGQGVGEEKSSMLLAILAGIIVNSLVVDTLHWRHLWFFMGISLSFIYDKER